MKGLDYFVLVSCVLIAPHLEWVIALPIAGICVVFGWLLREEEE